MKENFEKYFRAEKKASQGKLAKFPIIKDRYWVRYIYLKRFKVFPEAGGFNDQAYKFIQYLNAVTETETAIGIENAKQQKSDLAKLKNKSK